MKCGVVLIILNNNGEVTLQMGVDQWAALASVDQWEHLVRTNRIIQAYVTQCQVVHLDNKLLSQQDQPKQKVMTSNLTTQARRSIQMLQLMALNLLLRLNKVKMLIRVKV